MLQTLQYALLRTGLRRSDLLPSITGAAKQGASTLAHASPDAAVSTSADTEAGAADRTSNQASTSGRLPAKEDLVDKYLSMGMQSKGDQRSARLAQVLHEFRRHPKDVGSPEVVVATLTYRIRELAEHFNANRKHYGAMRHLEHMFIRRRRMLTYLRQNDFESYCFVLQRLGLKDIYVPISVADRFPEGMRHEDPTVTFVRDQRFNFHPEHKLKKTNLWNRLKPKLRAEDPVIR